MSTLKDLLFKMKLDDELAGYCDVHFGWNKGKWLQWFVIWMYFVISQDRADLKDCCSKYGTHYHDFFTCCM